MSVGGMERMMRQWCHAVQCKELLKSLQQVIGRTVNEEFLARALAINHHLVVVLENAAVASVGQSSQSRRWLVDHDPQCSGGSRRPIPVSVQRWLRDSSSSAAVASVDQSSHAAVASVDRSSSAAVASVDQSSGAALASGRPQDQETCSMSASNEDDINKETQHLECRSETDAMQPNTAPDVPLSHSMSDHDATNTLSITNGIPASAEQNNRAGSSALLPVQTTCWGGSLQLFEGKTAHTITSPAEDTFDL
ncbi:hypothetical protein CYMTET_20930 [Cymbomonas tetramitiformis]|uniref:Uncharacterized protein n=1 Tax=Cymbomonas tetramitiformis TaxID=36881 RepID=A0AAE0G3K5_9CHLO|nr:hypothetical protein CYMTET_20930 [Cymbomonas tetramitiformis]